MPPALRAALDRVLAVDAGLGRLRFAVSAAGSVALALATVSLLGLPLPVVLIGAVTAMVSATSSGRGQSRERAMCVLAIAPTMLLALALGGLLAPYRLVGDLAFLAVMFAGVYLRRYVPLGQPIGMAGFQGFFFAMFLRPPLSLLPLVALAIAIGAAATLVLILLLVPDTSTSVLRRTVSSVRAQLGGIVDDLADALADGAPLADGSRQAATLHDQLDRLRETMAQIQDRATSLHVDQGWTVRLLDVELATERLTRACLRTLDAGVIQDVRDRLADAVRTVHRLLDSDPRAPLDVDTAPTLHRLAAAGLGMPQSGPEDAVRARLTHAAVRELILSLASLRAASLTALAELASREPAPILARLRRTSASGAGAASDADPAVLGPKDLDLGAVGPAETDPESRHALDVGDDGSDPIGSGGPDHDDPEHDDPDHDDPEHDDPEHDRVGTDGAGSTAAPLPRWGTPARLALLPPTTRAAWQATIGGALAIAGGEPLSAQRWYWAVITSYVTFIGVSSRGELLVRGWRRVVGTLLGVIAGTVLALLLAGQVWVNLTIILVAIFVAFYLVTVAYAVTVFCITVMLGMLYDLLGTFTPAVLGLRVEETVIGASAAMLAAVFVLPTRTRTTVRGHLADALDAAVAAVGAVEEVLVGGPAQDLVGASRVLDRSLDALRAAAVPLTYRVLPYRERHGSTGRVVALLDELADSVRRLVRATEPGLVEPAERVDASLVRVESNLRVLADLVHDRQSRASELVSAEPLEPVVDVAALADHASDRRGEPEGTWLVLLHLRRVVLAVDRMDEVVLGLGATLGARTATPVATPLVARP